MNQNLLIFMTVMGFVLTFIYCWRLRQNTPEINVGNIVMIFFNAYGLCFAFLIIAAPFWNWAWKQVLDFKFYLIIAGVVATFTHGQELIRKIKNE